MADSASQTSSTRHVPRCRGNHRAPLVHSDKAASSSSTPTGGLQSATMPPTGARAPSSSLEQSTAAAVKARSRATPAASVSSPLSTQDGALRRS
ncbi:hypothetical protein CBOM_05360 [Ceraceosorus bombacis]|uniref:Uncharacterized protein n=1 Tax=Ceraceosorus bombacis TaxID=401625 RepID=A0A0P1BRU6_9BASI|nr:hypothetical protein CBOM_05360 [Ceraceosorus bombacis]